MSNIIRAVFSPGNYTTTAVRADRKPIWQWNYGQILQLHGLDLPKATEVHFSHSNISGDALIRIGTTTDKITEVAIPESFLEHSGKVTAYVYCSTVDHGQTEYKTYFKIEARAKPEAWDKPEDAEIFHEAIEAVNESADRAETAAGNAAASAESAHTDAGKTAADRTVVEQCKTQAAKSAENALQSEKDAGFSQEAAEVAQGQAEVYARQTQDDAAKTAADRVATGRDREAVAQDKTVANGAAERAESAEGNIAEMLSGAEATITGLQDATAEGNTATSNLNAAIKTARESNSTLTDTVAAADTKKQELDGSVATANAVLPSLIAENSSASSNLEELKSENFNSQEILSGVADLRAYLGLTADDIVGVQVDYKNKTFKRLAGAANLSKGADFDKFSMFGGRKRCNVADDGSIVAWYGDSDYKEDGSMGQVMVYQPKFYYLVCPVEYDPIDTGIGYHLRKANYYVSEKPRAGFRLHPAFYDASGNEIDYILDSAFEGSIWDADGGDGNGAYLMNDEQVMNTGTDKFCSIAGVKPASGLSQNLTRPNVEALAQNRGVEWHGDLIKPVSARQMLMIIELGMMNTQTGVGYGVTGISNDDSHNCSSLTGSTSELGNGSGKATQTINTKGDTRTTETANERVAVSWRGTENPWGNIWKFVYGVNIWWDGTLGGVIPYYATDFNFEESKRTDNYVSAGFSCANAEGYVSAIGYAPECDWMFMGSEFLGNSSVPVGDYVYAAVNLNGYTIAQLGGIWNYGNRSGAFCWRLNSGVGDRYLSIGGRLVLIPTKDSAVYTANITAWKQKMAA